MQGIAYIVDTETTDKEKAEVIELAALEVINATDTGAFFAQRYLPQGEIRFGAMATHHILMEDLYGMPPSAQARTDLPAMQYMIGHNIDFDWKMLGQPQVKRICTLALSRYVWPKLDSHSLSALIYAHSSDKREARERVRNAHSAEVDVRNNFWLLGLLMAELGIDSWDALWHASEEARIPTLMPFGKHRGQPISAVPRDYVKWYMGQADKDEYVVQAFRKAGLTK